MPTNFNEKERQIIGYIESQWFLRGSRPTPQELAEKFQMTQQSIGTFLEREEVKASLTSRGIAPIEANDLTADQIRVINLILNLSDTRSERKKLADENISARTWEGWKKNPKVRAYMQARAEDILGAAIPDAHLALVDRVRTGDISALKFYYEMTGRYTGQNQGLDPKILLSKVFDIITRHVQNPIVLEAIAADFRLLAGLDQTASINNVQPPVAGEVVPIQRNPDTNPSLRF